jgi:hypothetical protein
MPTVGRSACTIGTPQAKRSLLVGLVMDISKYLRVALLIQNLLTQIYQGLILIFLLLIGASKFHTQIMALY